MNDISSRILKPVFLTLIAHRFSKSECTFQISSSKDDIIMYADDTLLMSNAETLSESVLLCQNMLDKKMSWCDTNKLSVNIKKRNVSLSTRSLTR